jgi:hypothetical protein
VSFVFFKVAYALKRLHTSAVATFIKIYSEVLGMKHPEGTLLAPYYVSISYTHTKTAQKLKV